MMDATQIDDRIRLLYRENAAPSCAGIFKHRLEDRLLSVKQKRISRVPARAIVTVFASIVALAVLGIGAYQVVHHVTRDQSIVVITDDTTNALPGTDQGNVDSSTVTTPSDVGIRLGALKLDVTPRSGVELTIRLEQSQEPEIVRLVVSAANGSQSTFSLAAGDFKLQVDGTVLQTQVDGSQTKRVEVQPGASVEQTNYFWVLPTRRFTTVSLTYTSSDPESMGFTREVSAASSPATQATTGASTSTITTLPAPLPESAWPVPDTTPDPDRVASQPVKDLAELVAAHFPSLGLEVYDAVEVRYPSNTILEFGLASRESRNAVIDATIFKSDLGASERYIPGGSDVEIPGANDATLLEHSKSSGSGLLSTQLIATLVDGTVINCMSHVTTEVGLNPTEGSLLDKQGIIEMATYLASVISQGQVSLPDLSVVTSTTLPQAFLSRDIGQSCMETGNNALSNIAYAKEAEFITRLVPDAQSNGAAIYAAERKTFRSSGMSADHYSNFYSSVVVQWRNGAYLTEYGYFVQTRPAVPEEVDAWLKVDPQGRAAFGAVLWDKTVRWFRLEGQPDGEWLLVL